MSKKRNELLADLEEYAEACVDAYRGCGQRAPTEQAAKAAHVLEIFSRIVARFPASQPTPPHQANVAERDDGGWMVHPEPSAEESL